MRTSVSAVCLQAEHELTKNRPEGSPPNRGEAAERVWRLRAAPVTARRRPARSHTRSRISARAQTAPTPTAVIALRWHYFTDTVAGTAVATSAAVTQKMATSSTRATRVLLRCGGTRSSTARVAASATAAVVCPLGKTIPPR